MNNPRPPTWRRLIAILLSLEMVIAPIAPALAQTKLADEPIGFSPSAPPNIMLTVDDSTSMLADFLPDYVIGTVPGPGTGGFCRGDTGEMNSTCGFPGNPTTPGHIYYTGGVPFNTWNPGYTASTIPDRNRAWPAPAHNNALNRLYYDPSITYDSPIKYDGTKYPAQDAATTTNWTKVVADPWATTKTYVNLTTKVYVGQWCNTDFPNSTDWNPASGGGEFCRINGTDYSTMPTNKANADYNYPWNKTSGANDVKYFWRSSADNVGNGDTWSRQIYCDTTHAKFPKNLPCTVTGYTCSSGTYIPPAKVPQYCYDVGNKTGTCTNTYDPPGCNTNPLYGAPGPCKGSECLVCKTITCTAPSIGREGQCGTTSTRPQPPSTRADCDCTGAGCKVNTNHAACVPVTPPGMGTCSTGVTPTPVTTCTNNGSNDCGLKLYNPATKANDGLTLIADANGPGEVCRRNNRGVYPDGQVSGPFTFPTGKFTTTRNNGTCGTVPFMANIARHYWKTSVEWCTTQITTLNDRWKGFGLAGTCQDEHDLAHPYPRYYKYGVRKTDPEYLDNYMYPAFERVDLRTTGANYVHNWYRSGVLQTITRTPAEEMTNYSNWFSYYRTRIQAAKTVISQNFSYLDDAYRVGFHTLSNDPTSSFVPIDDFDATAGSQKEKWYTQLFAVNIAMGKQTPNMDALVRIGELYRTGASATLAGATDPIILSCQKNYHMLFTDGITNQAALPSTTVGNVDNMVPTLPVPIFVSPAIVAGSPWPPLYREDTAASMANTMSDYATHYWVTDLRPAMPNNVMTGRDPASWQHVNFAALSLGAEGVLSGSSPANVETQIASGGLKWPSPTPSQFAPNATGVEDLWHAAVNSRGRFVNAKTSQQLGRGIAGILQDITSPSGSAAAPTFANPNISLTNNYSYITKFEQGWSGNVQKVQIDPLTAATVGVIWDAKAQLETQLTITAGHPTPWYTKRKIVTLNEGGTAVPFLLGNLGPTQKGTLGPDTTSQTNVIEYIRGRRDMEGEDEGQFRVRTGPIGDIVDSAGMLVGSTTAPQNDYWDYIEANDPGYTAFKSSQSGRPGRIYVGANDGMLHVFDEATGEEVWSFIPNDFYRGTPPYNSGSADDKSGLAALTFQPGGLPIYDHRFYVNATPRVVDADVGTWKTLVVFGLGKGGKSYYALDGTNPGTVTSETAAAGKYLWKFTNADLGYTYGRAMITKTRAYGWVVIVPTGYNNTSGEGKIFILRASDGTLLKTMSTGVGTPASPSGLAHIAGYTRDYRNQITEQIYGGDLLGNVWRFDVSSSNEADWVVEKFAALTDGSGVPQPITTPPRIDIDIVNGIDRWVFVGTGKLLHVDDLPDTQTQRMYAMRDGTYNDPWPITGALTPADLSAVSGITGLGEGVIATKGWYDDLAPGQRIVRTSVAAVGLIAYIATSQPIDPCEVGLPATIFVRQFGSGASSLEAGGTLVESIYEPSGAAGLDMIATNPPGCTDNCIPDIKLAVLSSSLSQLITFKAKLPGITGERRMSWGPLNQ